MSAGDDYRGAARRVLLLVADGFDEESSVSCLHRLRETGQEVLLVGLRAGVVTGDHGIVVQPDCSLEQATAGAEVLAMVLPGGQRCVTTLLGDPRVHRLIADGMEDGERVGVLSGGEGIARRVLGSAPVLYQGNLTLDQFCRRLAGLPPGSRDASML